MPTQKRKKNNNKAKADKIEVQEQNLSADQEKKDLLGANSADREEDPKAEEDSKALRAEVLAEAEEDLVDQDVIIEVVEALLLIIKDPAAHEDKLSFNFYIYT